MRLIKNSRNKIEIPDNDLLGVADMVTIHSNHKVKSIKVNVVLSHSYPGDLSIELTAPNGEKETLLSPGAQDVSEQMQLDVTRCQDLCASGAKGEWTLRVIDAGMHDTGYLLSWQLDMLCIEEGDRLIEDQAILELHHYETAGGALESINCLLAVEHNHIGDLIINLIAPSGQSMVLHNRTGIDANTLEMSFNTYDLKVFKGEEVKGLWKLTVEDKLKGDTGRVKNWKIDLESAG